MFRAKQTDNKARLMNIKIEDHQTDKSKSRLSSSRSQWLPQVLCKCPLIIPI